MLITKLWQYCTKFATKICSQFANINSIFSKFVIFYEYLINLLNFYNILGINWILAIFLGTHFQDVTKIFFSIYLKNMRIFFRYCKNTIFSQQMFKICYILGIFYHAYIFHISKIYGTEYGWNLSLFHHILKIWLIYYHVLKI